MAARTVAIWGSCATRDAFAVASRQEELERELPLVYYGARSSWISQASPPWPQPHPDLGGEVNGFGRRMVQEDLGKTIVDQLVELQPDIVVFDLIDERLPIVRTGKIWLTASNYAKQTDLGRRVIAEADQTCTMTQPARSRLFSAAVRPVARRLIRELPRTAFVLNEAPYTVRVGGGGALPEPAAGWARELDEAQQPLFRALIGAMGGRLLRATPPPEVALADPDHRWGVTSYHYVEDYYHWFLDTLLAVEPPAETGAGSRIRLPSALRGVLRR